MDIKTEINDKYRKIELHVCNNELNDDVKAIVCDLHEMYDMSLSVADSKGNRLLIKPGEIISVYAEGQKVKILGCDDTYTIQKKLYELEAELGESRFVRISKSELVNIKKIKKLDLSMTGTIRLVMKNDYETFVSRRNVTKIKERLLSERSGQTHENIY